MVETKWWAIALIFFCTLITASAQIFLKAGADNISKISILTNYSLIIGMGMYVVGAVLMILAFKGGEVTVLYPIFATSYVWVLILSFILLKEPISSVKIVSIFLIMSGIFMVTRKSKVVDYVDVV